MAPVPAFLPPGTGYPGGLSAILALKHRLWRAPPCAAIPAAAPAPLKLPLIVEAFVLLMRGAAMPAPPRRPGCAAPSPEGAA
jgi:hypothetical protein